MGAQALTLHNLKKNSVIIKKKLFKFAIKYVKKMAEHTLGQWVAVNEANLLPTVEFGAILRFTYI